jgi:hypothetical protein
MAVFFYWLEVDLDDADARISRREARLPSSSDRRRDRAREPLTASPDREALASLAGVNHDG